MYLPTVGHMHAASSIVLHRNICNWYFVDRGTLSHLLGLKMGEKEKKMNKKIIDGCGRKKEDCMRKKYVVWWSLYLTRNLTHVKFDLDNPFWNKSQNQNYLHDISHFNLTLRSLCIGHFENHIKVEIVK